MLRAPFPLHTCHRQYPGAAIAGTTLLFSRNDLSLPRIDWQVGPHITLFEACSAFTHVAACILAKSPSDPLHRRLQPLRYLHNCSGCFRREQKSPGGIRTRRKGATFSWRTSNSGAHGAQRHKQGLDATSLALVTVAVGVEPIDTMLFVPCTGPAHWLRSADQNIGTQPSEAR